MESELQKSYATASYVSSSGIAMSLSSRGFSPIFFFREAIPPSPTLWPTYPSGQMATYTVWHLLHTYFLLGSLPSALSPCSNPHHPARRSDEKSNPRIMTPCYLLVQSGHVGRIFLSHRIFLNHLSINFLLPIQIPHRI